MISFILPRYVIINFTNKMKVYLEDTITAISTPIGEGGIGIVRLSGPQSLEIADQIFVGKVKPSEVPTYTTHYGHIVFQKEIIDEVILTVMRAPGSYTREDIVEINCHGGIVPLKMVLEIVLQLGARLAQPGEFTRRAFLNGRIDLVQAEAVVDIIRAKTDLSLRAAVSQLEGKLSAIVRQIREALIKVLASIEAAIDFVEEDIEIISQQEILERLENIGVQLQNLLATAEGGKILREGISMVIAGRPNVGKSSLLNAFLREQRAIVTPIPGTTRDVIEEIINMEGIPLKIADTAGIRPVHDIVEKEGVARSRSCIQRSDLVLLLFDGSEALTEEDRQLLKEIKDKKAILVINKIDLPQQIEIDEIKPEVVNKPLVKISATEEIGLSQLEKTIVEMVWRGEVVASNGTLVTNVRHRNALREANSSIQRAIETTSQGRSEELIAVDIRAGMDSLGEIIGETVTEDILDYIFSEFCLGK